MLVAGLTGGIASGKSTVARIMGRAGAVVIDADQIAHQVMAPGEQAWHAVQDVFGPGILSADGRIDRQALGELVFQDDRLRRQLEQIVHPYVRARMDDQTERIVRTRPEALIIQDVPLLLEAGMQHGLDEIIVVYVPERIQLRRLMQRDGIDREAALARIRAQMPMEEKKQRATMVIDNSGTPAATEKQALEVYHKLAGKAAENLHFILK